MSDYFTRAGTSRTDSGRGTEATALSRNLQSLETLRIIAALLVVCAHVPPYDLPLIGQFFGTTRFLGSIGVDLFFVISGVVIGLSTIRAVTADADQPLVNFIIARIFRIIPLYWVVTAITLVLLWRKGLPHPVASELVHSLALIPRLESKQYVDPIVHIGWTLQFEVFFYALCAMGILLRSKWLPLAAAVVLAAASFAFEQYYFNPILLEFAGGYALALRLAGQSQPVTRLGPLVVIGLLTAVTGIFLYAATGRDSGYPPTLDVLHAPRMFIMYGDDYLPRWVAWGLPAIALVAVALRLETSIHWRLAFLGKYTYSIYLCHTFAIAAALAAARHLSSEKAMALLLPVCILAIASFTYRAIEYPMIQLGKRMTHRLHTRPITP